MTDCDMFLVDPDSTVREPGYRVCLRCRAWLMEHGSSAVERGEDYRDRLVATVYRMNEQTEQTGRNG